MRRCLHLARSVPAHGKASTGAMQHCSRGSRREKVRLFVSNLYSEKACAARPSSRCRAREALLRRGSHAFRHAAARGFALETSGVRSGFATRRAYAELIQMCSTACVRRRTYGYFVVGRALHAARLHGPENKHGCGSLRRSPIACGCSRCERGRRRSIHESVPGCCTCFVVVT